MVVGGPGPDMKPTSAIEDCLEDHAFPSTTGELIEAHGDAELEHPNGVVTLGEALECLPDEDLATPEEARLAAYSALGDEAIGRKAYSDRDPTAIGERGHEPLSL